MTIVSSTNQLVYQHGRLASLVEKGQTQNVHLVSTSLESASCERRRCKSSRERRAEEYESGDLQSLKTSKRVDRTTTARRALAPPRRGRGRACTLQRAPRPVAQPDGLNNENFCRDPEFIINLAGETPAVDALTCDYG